LIESKRIPINQIIVQKNDILRVASFFEEQYKQIKKMEPAYTEFWLYAQTISGEGYKFEDVKEFNTSHIWDMKRVTSFGMRTSTSRDVGVELHLEVSHGDSSFNNSFTVSGKDPTWVKGVSSQFEELLRAATPQSNFVEQHRILFVGITTLMLGWLFLHLFLLFVDLVVARQTHFVPTTADLVFISVLSVPLGLLLAVNIVFKAEALWPAVEFQIGPEHEKTEKRRRYHIGWLIGAVVVPFVVSVLYDIIKGIFLR
jgi:hypothetical protein